MSVELQLQQSFRKLFWVIFLAYAVVLLAGLSSIIALNRFQKGRLAYLLVTASKNSIVSGDFRSAIVVFSQSIPDEFRAIEFVDPSGKSLFRVPAGDDDKESRSIDVGTIEESISFGSNDSAGLLRFSYSRTRGVFFVFTVWSALLLFSIPLIRRSKHQIIRQYGEESRSRRNAALAELASQVSHDIRSPLAALKIASKDLSSVPEETRLLLDTAIARINGIASQLLKRNKDSLEQFGGREENRDFGLVAAVRREDAMKIGPVLRAILIEKRIEFQTREDLSFVEDFEACEYSAIQVDPIDFGRVISNLLNNAIEAIYGPGKVVISGRATGKTMEIAIADNGCGISSDVLGRLGKRGLTLGKTGGSGLGLYHARTSVENWGGELVIESEMGVGTVVRIRLPYSD